MAFPRARTRPLKYSRSFDGNPVKSCEDMLEAIERRRYFFIGNNPRPQHWGWIGNMSFGRLASLIKGGDIHIATRNPEVPYVFDIYLHPNAPCAEKVWAMCDELPGGIITAKTEQGIRRACRTKLHSFCYDVPTETIKIQFRIHTT